MTACVGNLLYLAPEVFEGENYTQLADVYSFGIVAWETLARRQPFESMAPQKAAYSAAVHGVRPRCPETWPSSLRSLIENCWQKNPRDRPSFWDISQQLSVIYSDINSKIR